MENNIAVTSNEMLQTVSRSFALSIPLLDSNKVRDMENTYLLSRVADTIEDSSLSVEEKKTLMATFFETFDGKNIDAFVRELRRGTIDEHDKILSIRENYEAVLNTFHSLDARVQRAIIDLLTEMSSGMLKYLEKEITNFKELDEYCYYVAGTVGIFMNRLVEIKDGVHLSREKTMSFGRYLQKVNIIKNFRKDIDEGRSFWPTELAGRSDRDKLAAMIESAKNEAQSTFEYALSIPYDLIGYRRFVLLVSFMAAESLRIMENNEEVFTNEARIKIPRSRMPEIFAMVEEAAQSNEALIRHRKELEG
jgi:farnesyl-diphosphate farnesyltransferase